MCFVESISLLPGAGERHSTRDKGHEEGGSAYAKVDQLSHSSKKESEGSSHTYSNTLPGYIVK